jgi:hypothetical protein
MHKRGQLTIMIIVGIVIIIGILAFFILKGEHDTNVLTDDYFEGTQIKSKVNAIRDHVDDCMSSVTKEALIVIAFQGGYNTPPPLHFRYDPVFFPYYYYEGKVILPTIEDIESELGSYVNEKVIDCLNQGSFTGFNLEYENMRTIVKVTRDNAYFEPEMPITITHAGHKMTLELSEYHKNYNSSLFEIYEVAKYITESHSEDSEYYCVSCVTEMASQRDLYVYLFPRVANELITGISIYENRTGIGDPYSFIFFNKYTGDERTPKLNT